MGLCVVDNALVRAVLSKLLKHPAHAVVVRAGIELAVGEGARAALTELDVRLGIERTARAEGIDGGFAL